MSNEPLKIPYEVDFTLEVMDNQHKMELVRSMEITDWLGDSTGDLPIGQGGIVQKMVTLDPNDDMTTVTFPRMHAKGNYLTFLIENPNVGEVFYNIFSQDLSLRDGFILEHGFHLVNVLKETTQVQPIVMYFMRVNPAPRQPMTVIVTIFSDINLMSEGL